MKRDKNIMPLSRDHHFGLLFCWKIRQGIKLNIDPARIERYVLYYWNDHLQKHFQEEESMLFVLKDDVKCRRAIEEHRQIKQTIANIRSHDVDVPLLQSLANKVEDHIRFEERELFPYLEKALDEIQLARIGAALQSLHVGESADDYKDEFWVKAANT